MSLTVNYNLGVASQWLGIRILLLGSLLTTLLALSIVLNEYYSFIPINPGIAGLSILYSFSIVNNFNGVVNAFAETEQELISVERVLEYSKLPSEFLVDEMNELAPSLNDDRRSYCCSLRSKKIKKYSYLPVKDQERMETDEEIESTNQLNSSLLSEAEAGELSKIKSSERFWQYIQSVLKTHCFFPNGEGIRFQNLSMKYESNNEYALKDINLYIECGSRVMVIGRTGSGKSSLLRCLLRLNDYQSGSLTFNSFELQLFSKQLLRKTITVLPQKPLLFNGDLKLNVDPLNLFSEEEIMLALYESSFLMTLSISKEEDEIATSPAFERKESYGIDWSKGVDNTIQDVLSFCIEEGGRNLSWGQKQLLCLARALLRKSDLILIDEVSASLDAETKNFVFSALRRHFNRNPSTILLIITHQTEGVDSLCNQVKFSSSL